MRIGVIGHPRLDRVYEGRVRPMHPDLIGFMRIRIIFDPRLDRVYEGKKALTSQT